MNNLELLKARMIAVDEYFQAKQDRPLSLEFYLIALAGEVGEAANLYKKHMRGDMPWSAIRDEFAMELADIRIYLEHLARVANIDLDSATADKLTECECRWNIPTKSPT